MKAAVAICSVFCVVVLFPGFLLGADRIVLRNLDIISDQSVVQFNEDGVRLNDGRLIGWDRIENGRVGESEQAEFDAMLEELGSHLYRIRQRLSVNDYRGVLAHAEAVHDRYVGRCSETAYMVFQSLMWARLAVGRREAALPPYLNCVECLRRAAAEQRELTLPGARRLQVDLETGLSPELPPVWFDAEAAGAYLSETGRAISVMAEPRPPATRVYYATLALAADERGKARQALSGLEQLLDLKAIIEAQMRLSEGETAAAIEALDGQVDQLEEDVKPLALYWLGAARVSAGDPETRTAGLLDMLRIPAFYGEEQRELAAAGLYAAMHALAAAGDRTGSIAVRRELLDRYSRTWHARRVRTEDKKAQ